jgi:gliding motility-associated-like protein
LPYGWVGRNSPENEMMIRPIYLIRCLIVLCCLNKVAAQKLYQTNYVIQEHICKGDLFIAKSGNDEAVMATSLIDADAYYAVYPTIVKIRPSDGSVLWGLRYTDQQQSFHVRSLETAPNGDILISGFYDARNIAINPRPFIMLLNKTGAVKWIRLSSDIVFNHIVKAIFLSDNSVVVSYTVLNLNVILCRYTAEGQEAWSENIQSYVPPDPQSIDIVKDIAELGNGNIVVLTENNQDGAVKKSGVVEVERDGRVMRHVNLESVTDNDVIPTSILVGKNDDLLISVSCGNAVSTVKLIDMDSVAWQTNPFNINSEYSNFVLSGGKGDEPVFISGRDQNTPQSTVRVMRYDSFTLSKSILIVTLGQLLTNGTAAPLVMGTDLLIPSVAPEVGGMILTKVTTDFEACKEFPTDIPQASFPTLKISSYPARSAFISFNFSVLSHLIKQSPFLVDTFIGCQKNYFSCRKAFGLGGDTSLCNAKNFQLTSDDFEGYSYLWSTGDTLQNINVTESGTYSLKVIPPPGFDCDTLSDEQEVTFVSIPPVRYALSAKNVWPGDEVTITCNHSFYDHITWKIKDKVVLTGPSFIHSFNKNGSYTIKIEAVKEPCMVSDSVDVGVYGFTVFMPNAFTPNSDGTNDVFEPVGAGIDQYVLEVYNRWGSLVYKGNNKGWNGTVEQKPASGGTYVYLLECFDEGIKMKRQKGTVELIR